MALASYALLADRAFLAGSVFSSLPAFTVSAASFVGFLIALLWHQDLKGHAKAKGKRRFSMALMGANLLACILATGYWLITILAEF